MTIIKTLKKVRFQVKKVQEVTGDELKEIWHIYALHHNVACKDFLHRTTARFDTIVTYRQRKSRRLIGFCGVRIDHLRMSDGQRVITLYIGQAYVRKRYRGMGLLPLTDVRILLKTRWRHPLMPIHFWFDAISYKAYLVLAQHVRYFCPRQDKCMPANLLGLRDQLGVLYYQDQYDAVRGRVIKGSNRLKPHVADLSETDLRHPDVLFYTEQNPGYANGDGLICIVPGTLSNVISFLLRHSRRDQSF